MFMSMIFCITLSSVFIDMLTPESVKLSRDREKQQKDSVIRTENQERRLKHKEEQRKKHLHYVVVRFPRKDSVKDRFIVANTSLADIDSGKAIVFSHSWAEKTKSKQAFDTTKIALRPIPSGLRDTLSIKPLGAKMNCIIDSVALVDIMFR
jgi:hypothetical protein